MEKVLTIEGMHCEKCVAAVKDALEALSAVDSAEVTLEPQRAVVHLNKEVIDQLLVAVVVKAGFSAEVS